MRYIELDLPVSVRISIFVIRCESKIWLKYAKHKQLSNRILTSSVGITMRSLSHRLFPKYNDEKITCMFTAICMQFKITFTSLPASIIQIYWFNSAVTWYAILVKQAIYWEHMKHTDRSAHVSMMFAVVQTLKWRQIINIKHIESTKAMVKSE